MEPLPPAVEAWSLNHWTAREVPGWFLKLQDEKKKNKKQTLQDGPTTNLQHSLWSQP